MINIKSVQKLLVSLVVLIFIYYTSSSLIATRGASLGKWMVLIVLIIILFVINKSKVDNKPKIVRTPEEWNKHSLILGAIGIIVAVLHLILSDRDPFKFLKLLYIVVMQSVSLAGIHFGIKGLKSNNKRLTLFLISLNILAFIYGLYGFYDLIGNLRGAGWPLG